MIDTPTLEEKYRRNVVRHKVAARALRDYFLKWQCRARQNSARKNAGKPSESMCPTVVIADRALSRIVVVINKRERFSTVPEFRHMVLRTHDPRKRYESGLELLSAEYYQVGTEFTDRLTALFGPGDPLVDTILGQGGCTLEFSHTRQYFSLPCKVVGLDIDSYLFQATYWHNYLFNPAMPPDVNVVEFRPDWSRAIAEPEPT